MSNFQFISQSYVVEQIQQFQKAKAMGLFFHQYEHEYSLRGTCHWTDEGRIRKQCSIKGIFHERDPTGFVNSIEFNANDEKIYFYQGENLKSLDLNLTVLQDHFYYSENQSKSIENVGVYEIKLKRKNLLTIIYTENFQNFISFYKHLAKHTILTCFQKHFKLLKLIGRGSTSKVYIGQNLISKEEVALKVFQKKSNIANHEENIVISNEIVNLEKLRKFNLSPLIGVYETSDCVIIAMQKAGAGNMINYLQQHAADYNQELIRNIIYKVLQSLKELHAAGFIHKDIKPDNILFNNYTKDSGVFLGDFGSSIMKKDAGISPVGRISTGTLGFIAPEILKENHFDEKCDLFSVGSLLYFLLMGEPLFAFKTANQIYTNASDDKDIQAKIDNIPSLNDNCRDLIKQLLKANPCDRISASDALNHPFLANIRPQRMCAGEQNFTLEEYIKNRAKKYFQ